MTSHHQRRITDSIPDIFSISKF